MFGKARLSSDNRIACTEKNGQGNSSGAYRKGRDHLVDEILARAHSYVMLGSSEVARKLGELVYPNLPKLVLMASHRLVPVNHGNHTTHSSNARSLRAAD